MARTASGCGTRRTSFSTTCCICPTSAHAPLKVRSMVGLIPLFAVETLEPEIARPLPDFKRRLRMVPEAPAGSGLPGLALARRRAAAQRRLLSLLRGHRMKRLLQRMLDETEFLSDYGVRALSQHHDEHPYVFRHRRACDLRVRYSRPSPIRGHVRRQFQLARADLVSRQFPASSNRCRNSTTTTATISRSNARPGRDAWSPSSRSPSELAHRLSRIFLKDGDGRRPVSGAIPATCRPTRISATIAVLRIFPRRQRPRRGRLPSDRLDRR